MLKRMTCMVVVAGLISPVFIFAADPPAVDKGVTSSAGINGNNNNAAASSEAKAGADKQFVMEAASGGMLEVQLGQLVSQRGQSDTVRNFGKMMVEDHSKANEQLMNIAHQKNITVSKELNEKDRATLQKMQKMNGADLDRAYMSGMVEDHKNDIAAFENEAKNGADPDVKAFAQQTLPTLQTHLQHAEKGVALLTSDRTDKAQPAGEKQNPDSNQGKSGTDPKADRSQPRNTSDRETVTPAQTPNNQGTPGTSIPAK